MRRAALTLVLFALALQPGRAQTQATYRVAGTVVSAMDNHPLQRAKVQLLNPANESPIQSTTSDEYGHFAFTGVPAGNHELQGSAPNYLATYYDDHYGFNTGIVTGAGVDTESLVLKLRPQSSISGTVVNEAAEPVQNATIHLFRESHNFGDSSIVSAATASTDDLGHFELVRLIPGDYYLAVTATPWYAVHPNAQQQGPVQFVDSAGNTGWTVNRTAGQQAFGVADSVDPALNVAYAATFYPGTTEAAHATPIHLGGGTSLDVSFELSPQPAVTLILPHAPPSIGRPSGFPQVGVSFRGQTLPAMGDTRQTQTQTIISGIAPGDYVLSDGNVGFQRSGTPVHLSERTTNATPPEAAGTAHIRVTLQAGYDTHISPHAQVVLFRSNRDAAASQPVDEKNQATLDVAPGDYSFTIYGMGQQLAVGKVIEAERTLPSNRIHLTAGEIATFTVTAVSRNHTLKAVVREDGKPCPGAFILLIPTGELADPHTYYRQQSDLDGSFDIGGLAPGEYTLFAIDGGWDVDWQQPGALARYAPAAVAVRIPDTAEKIITLPAPVPAQPK